jgi:arabinofuranosyltransferase
VSAAGAGRADRGRARNAALAAGIVLAVLGAGLGLFLAREQSLAGTRGFPLDDSWIHLHFARNLAEGAGFSYNPGVPLAGSTAPLWTLILAAVFWLGGEGVVGAKIVGTGLAAGVALLTWRLALAWTGSRGLALLAGAGLGSSGPLLWGALSGMEVTLAALLVTAALLAHTWSRPWVTGALLALATLARPEAVLVVPPVCLAGRLTVARAAAFTVPLALVLTPWAGFNLWTTGSLLPATASAKVEGGLVAFVSGSREPLLQAVLRRPLSFGWEWVTWLWSVNALLPLLVLPGLAATWARAGRTLLLPASTLLLHPIGMALLAAYRGPGFQEGRYSIHLLPLAFTVAVMALVWTDALAGARRRRAARAGLALALVIGAAVALPPAASRYGWAVQNIEAMQVHLGRWVETHTPSGARLALNDVGAIAYLSRREVVDMIGLITPDIIAHRRQGEPAVLRYLEAACPDYLIVFPAWFPALTREQHFTPIYRVRLENNTVAGADEMVVYETAWNRWRPAPRPCTGPVSGSSGAGPGARSYDIDPGLAPRPGTPKSQRTNARRPWPGSPRSCRGARSALNDATRARRCCCSRASAMRAFTISPSA